MPTTYRYTTLNNPLAANGGAALRALGINDSGQIVGWYQDTSIRATAHGFLYSGGTYTTLDPPSATRRGGNRHQRFGTDRREIH
jgi:probable HAF family extracellular repeat protein